MAVCPLPEQHQLLAHAPESARFHWLNEHAWLIYALCDGSTSAEIAAAYARQGGGAADDRFALGVAGLAAAGLVVPVGG
ncbi:hypothetical protein ACFQ0T_15245 [Kitasatospora gansuensis]